MNAIVIIVLIGVLVFSIWMMVMLIKSRKAYKDKLTSTTPITDYNPTNIIPGYISADFNTKRWRPEVVKNAKVWRFSDIVNAKILVDGASASHGYKTTASSIVVRITMNNPEMQLIDISVMDASQVGMNTFLYKQSMNNAEEIVSLIDSIKSGKNSEKPSSNTDTSTELRKLKELLDEGIITQEEFDAKKRKILDL